MVSTMGQQTWHRSKGQELDKYNLHDGLEDGTLPFHSILALGEAIDVHQRLYGSMEKISQHTSWLTYRLYRGLEQLRHLNGRAVCRIYSESKEDSGKASRQGPVIAFNVLYADGNHRSYSDVERMANEAGIYIRSGGKSFTYQAFHGKLTFW